MKLKNIAGNFAIAASALVLFAGCPASSDGPSGNGGASENEGSSGSAQSAAPERQAEGEEFRIEIAGDDRMQFDVTEFEVQPNQPVTIVFTNKGTMPKESMGHNVVVLEKDVDVMEFANASARHVRNDYIDPERAEVVIANTRILGPGETQEISFVAPSESGEFPYICTFPGHVQAGMRGVMTVK